MNLNLARNKVWFSLLGVLSIVLVVLLVQTALGNDSGNKPDTGDLQTEAPVQGLQVNAYPKINALAQKYYSAATHGNTETLKEIVVPFDEQDESSAVRMSEFIEEYQNITCYTENGVEEGTYIAFICYDLKFPNVDTPAPGMDTFFIFTDEKGELYFNNDETARSEALNAQLQELQLREDVIALMQDVNNRFNQALQTDPNLQTLVAQLGRNTNATEAPDGAENQQPAVDPQATPAPLGDVKREMMAVVDLEIYPEAKAENAIDSISVGKTVWVDQNVAGGFSYIDKDGVTGYVQTSGLSLFEAVDQEITVTVNYYRSCSSSASVAGTITSDQSTYCSLKFGNGWRQIIVNGEKFYIKEADLGGSGPASRGTSGSSTSQGNSSDSGSNEGTGSTAGTSDDGGSSESQNSENGGDADSGESDSQGDVDDQANTADVNENDE